MSTELITPQPQSESLALIARALDSNVDPASLRELLSVKREWEADEARKSYFAAISEFQRRAPIIEKLDDAHGKKYAAMDRIWRTIRPLFTELGLSCTWQSCEVRDALCHVEGQLAHVSGHSVALKMDVAIPELIRGQNAAQQIGSASTYAKRYAFCAALGLQTGEDDDGHNAGTQFVTREQTQELEGLLSYCPEGTESALLEWAQCQSLAEIPAAKFAKAVQTLKSKIK